MPEVDALRAGDPQTLGPYELRGVLGEGGQGTVYLGSGPDGLAVAVKVLHGRLRGDERARRLFLREASVARSVAPYCTARIVDADIEGDRPYIVSEYVEGESLQELVRRTGPRDPGGLERLAISTAAALKGIHEAGIAHRDFKPGNVLLGPDGPRVVDFGIARIVEGTSTVSSGILGTPAYMSPEQISGATVGAPSDIFSWAVTMVFAATGRPAFGQDSIPAVLHRVLNEHPDLSAIPPRLHALVTACLAKDPAQRPTAADLLTAILAAPAAPDAPAQAAPIPRQVPAPSPSADGALSTAPPPFGTATTQPPEVGSPAGWAGVGAPRTDPRGQAPPPGPAPVGYGYPPPPGAAPGGYGYPAGHGWAGPVKAERPVPFVAGALVQAVVFVGCLIGLLVTYYEETTFGIPATMALVTWIVVGSVLTVVLRRKRNRTAR